MQPIKFQSVEEMLDFLPEDELLMTERLRSLIIECIPNVEERLSYNVPFYRLRRGICFIWPGAVAWGSKRSYEGVRLGFMQGNLLSDEHGILRRGERKFVCYVEVKDWKKAPIDAIRQCLFEAAIIDIESERKA
ncbi:MAG: DUF1801 domain-containing protein [Flavobacteriales bacterium]|nr:DUF1801 domain-containing protein [Flavobacteriales bacterium]